MQIGRQLNRGKPRLDKEEYSDGLKDLISFSLDSDPKSRPSMADVIGHSFLADTEESHPISSLGELVRMYYQWLQRGGQRISLFHPGGAAAAEFPNPDDTFEGDWNFSTTDGFERRFSVIDLDELAASLAELDNEISPTAAQPEKKSLDEPREMELSGDDKANFDERVRRGAAAMEGLFDEEKPGYKYETKNDFIPVEQRRPPSDLPLRTDTDRSSVTSTFIDIDIGSFDSSHYAAGATPEQPIQLADADTIKANRSSGRQQRNSNEARSRSSSGGLAGQRDSQDTFQPQTGPRPPTMDWKFPVFMQPPQEEEPESKDGESTPEAKPAESNNTADKRATLEWTFPVMSAPPEEEMQDSSRFETLKAPLVGDAAGPSEIDRPASFGEPGDSRPSTSSAGSDFTTGSEADYDPFRLDRPSSPSGVTTTSTTHDNAGIDDFPEIIDPSQDDNDDVYPTLLDDDGPGPDEDSDDNDILVLDDAGPDDVPSTDRPSHRVSTSEPFPTAIPCRDNQHHYHHQSDLTHRPCSVITTTTTATTATSTGASASDVHNSPLAAARRDPSTISTGRSTIASHNDVIRFPDLVPPSVESLTEGVEHRVLVGELDRLLGDFLDALSATGEALRRTATAAAAGPPPSGSNAATAESAGSERGSVIVEGE